MFHNVMAEKNDIICIYIGLLPLMLPSGWIFHTEMMLVVSAIAEPKKK